MEWNYYDTFITVAADCPVEYGTPPPDKKDGKTKPGIEFELAAAHPYRYTQKELLFEVYARHKGIPPEALAADGDAIKEAFYRKPQPCMRASMLTKRYGWGIHFDREGRLALIPRESPAYQRFLDGEMPGVRVLPAMRNSRK